MMSPTLARLLTPDRRTILWNSSTLVATTVVTAGLGFGFWWLAARRFSAQQVGLAAAAVSAMTLLGFIGMLGFGTLLIAEIHRRGERAMAYIATAILVNCAAGAVLGAVAVLAAPYLSPEFATFTRDAAGQILFPVGVGLTAATFVADQALIGLLRGGTQFLRNAVFAAAKLALLAVAGVALAATSVTIFATWVAGLAASTLVIGAIALRHERRLDRYRPDSEILRHLGRGMLKHHALNMAVQAPSLALPVVVATALSTTAAGYFYVAWMVAGFIAVAAPALGLTLYAVGSRSPAGLANSIRLTLALSFLITGLGCLAAIVGGRLLLSTFGAAYATEGTSPLIILALAMLPGIVKGHFVQVQRIAGRLGTAAAILAVGALLELSAAVIGAQRGGLVGLSEGYMVSVFVEAAVMGPSVIRAAGLWRRSSART
jgi:O-antigen/teichoic acid export membrane protein